MLPHEPNALSSLSDKLTIETPEQMPLEFAVAGIGSRFLAVAVDSLIQVGIGLGLLILLGILGVTSRWMGLRNAGVWLMAALGFCVFALMFGYFAAFEILWNGQTPGKRVVGIRAVKETGRPLTPSEAIGRNLLRIVDQLPAFYAVGILVAVLNAKNKRLGDFIAGSVVVSESSMKEHQPHWHQAQPAGELSAGGARVSIGLLSLEELALIDVFLQRRHDLAPDVRARMAGDILARLQPKVAGEAQTRLSTESLLEALAYERRSSGSFS